MIRAALALAMTTSSLVPVTSFAQSQSSASGTLGLSAVWFYQSRFSTTQTDTTPVPYIQGYDTLTLLAGVRGIGNQPLDLDFSVAFQGV